MNITKLLIEAFVVGIATVVLGYVGSYLAVKILPTPKKGEYFNKYYVMELSLFLTGFLAHLLFEFFYLNRWYCKHGNACSK